MKNYFVVPGILLFAVFGVMNAAELPDPLIGLHGEKIATAEAWKNKRRAEVLELFRQNVYGREPVGHPDSLRFETMSTDPKAMDEKATLKQIKISFKGPGGEGAIRLTLFVPNSPVPKPHPCFVLICNRGLENIDPTRKEKSPFWPAESIVSRGYAAAAFHVGDLDPDFDDGFTNGVHGIFDKPGTRRPDSWGTIAAWAWGASRVMDYLETDPDINAKKVCVVGHSRGGKTALWAGAEDERFAIVVSNDSGCTGAALTRGKAGEHVRDINQRFPHWFCQNYKKFNDHEEDLPVDQHMLDALIAPRPLYVASATADTWSDPKSEFQAAILAGPVYRLFGIAGLIGSGFPKPETPLQDGNIAYHIRTGQHDLTEYDWSRFIDFADKKLKGVKGD